jgi:hypothetical protein
MRNGESEDLAAVGYADSWLLIAHLFGCREMWFRNEGAWFADRVLFFAWRGF